jgi:DNA-binding SARP family transcriptional activator
VVITEYKAYRLLVAPESVDVDVFHTLVDQSRMATELRRERELLGQALDLHRGPFLFDVPCESLRREFEPAIHETYLQALSRRIEIDTDTDPLPVLAELRRLVTENPIREQFWVHLMYALNRVGRKAEALQCYEQCRRSLVQQLGVDPGLTVRQMYERILGDDPALLAASPRPSVTEVISPRSSWVGVV